MNHILMPEDPAFQWYEHLVDALGTGPVHTAYERAALARIVAWASADDCAVLTRLVRKARRDAFQLGRLNAQADPRGGRAVARSEEAAPARFPAEGVAGAGFRVSVTFASWLDHHHQVGQLNRAVRAADSCQRSSAPPARSRNPTVAAAPIGNPAPVCGNLAGQVCDRAKKLFSLLSSATVALPSISVAPAGVNTNAWLASGGPKSAGSSRVIVWLAKPLPPGSSKITVRATKLVLAGAMKSQPSWPGALPQSSS